MGQDAVFGPENRQTLAALPGCQGLRNKSGKSFGENYFGALKGRSRGNRYRNLTLDKNNVRRWHVQGCVSQPNRGFSSQGLARRPWRNRPCEPRVETHLTRPRPPTVPESVLSHGRTRLRKS